MGSVLNWWRERRAPKRERFVEQAAVDREKEKERQEEKIRDLQEKERLHQQAPWGSGRL
jgi:hypothetical protein